MTNANRISLLATAAIAALASVATPASAQDATNASPQTITAPSTAGPVLTPQTTPSQPVQVDLPPMKTTPTATTVAPQTTTSSNSTASDVPVDPQALAEARAEDAQRRADAQKQAEAKAQAAHAAAIAAARRNAARDATTAPAIQAAPAQPVEAAPQPAIAQPVVTPQANTPVAATAQSPDNSRVPWLWLALAAGLAVVVAGAALLMRRKRSTETVEAAPVEYAETPAMAETRTVAEPVAEPAVATPEPQPAFIASRRAEPTEARYVEPAAAATAATAGSSVMGRHERAALAGPTPDNPFLTRKNRLRRARFFDRKERLAAEAARRPAETPWTSATAPAKPQTTTVTSQVSADRRPQRFNWANPGMKPAFGK